MFLHETYVCFLSTVPIIATEFSLMFQMTIFYIPKGTPTYLIFVNENKQENQPHIDNKALQEQSYLNSIICYLSYSILPFFPH